MARIGVVTDDSGFEHFLEAVTAADGYKLAVYGEPGSWASQLLRDPPDLVILDRMAGHDSVTLRAAMRTDPRLEAIPAILVLDALPLERPPWLRLEVLARKPPTHRSLRLLINRVLYQGGLVLSDGLLVLSPSDARPLLAEFLGSPQRLKQVWLNPHERESLVIALEREGWTEQGLRRLARRNDLDLYDMLGWLAFGWTVKTRQQRAYQAWKWAESRPDAKIIHSLLSAYVEYGISGMEKVLRQEKVLVSSVLTGGPADPRNDQGWLIRLEAQIYAD
ncbi:type I restriction-modification enzyme R subunit C-terminal domain-containing protein [Calidithermus chliarophilus]|uniref:type I restriction-modification enzyme R subunit C-terminal domain-containing protein n=1 Tax=Calidithermus chliarophilus TaxID=52023 RepID=UPI00040C9BE0|nr:type I restriction-modification enzyme R subunit C-terminal domain-containing protein [Calidithermus chliarophilus]